MFQRSPPWFQSYESMLTRGISSAWADFLQTLIFNHEPDSVPEFALHQAGLQLSTWRTLNTACRLIEQPPQYSWLSGGPCAYNIASAC